MRKNYLFLVLIPLLVGSCAAPNNIIIQTNDPNTLEPIKNEVYSPIAKEKEVKSITNAASTNVSQEVIKTTEEKSELNNEENLNLEVEQVNNFNTNLLSNSETDSISSTLVAKPAENVDPSTLISKPADNIDPSTLVAKPAENVDPDKIASIETGIGFTNIVFSHGVNQVNLNVELSEFKILSSETSSESVDTIDIVIKLNGKQNQTVTLSNNVFSSKPFLLITLKGLRDLENLTVVLVGKNINKNTIYSKQVLNDSLKGNKNISTTFYKGPKTSNSNIDNNEGSNSQN